MIRERWKKEEHSEESSESEGLKVRYSRAYSDKTSVGYLVGGWQISKTKKVIRDPNMEKLKYIASKFGFIILEILDDLII